MFVLPYSFDALLFVSMNLPNKVENTEIPTTERIPSAIKMSSNLVFPTLIGISPDTVVTELCITEYVKKK